MAGERLDVLAGVGVPDFDRLVLAAGGDGLAVGAEGEAPDAVGVAGVAAQGASGVGVPDDDGAVGAGGDDAPAVGAEGDGLDDLAVTESAVAEEAGDVVGQSGRQAGQVPAGLAEGVGGLDESAGRQRLVAALGVGVGPLIPIGREFLGQALGVGPLRAELRMQVTRGRIRRRRGRRVGRRRAEEGQHSRPEDGQERNEFPGRKRLRSRVHYCVPARRLVHWCKLEYRRRVAALRKRFPAGANEERTAKTPRSPRRRKFGFGTVTPLKLGFCLLGDLGVLAVRSSLAGKVFDPPRPADTIHSFAHFPLTRADSRDAQRHGTQAAADFGPLRFGRRRPPARRRGRRAGPARDGPGRLRPQPRRSGDDQPRLPPTLRPRLPQPDEPAPPTSTATSTISSTDPAAPPSRAPTACASPWNGSTCGASSVSSRPSRGTSSSTRTSCPPSLSPRCGGREGSTYRR